MTLVHEPSLTTQEDQSDCDILVHNDVNTAHHFDNILSALYRPKARMF
jgi:hypothetical protein